MTACAPRKGADLTRASRAVPPPPAPAFATGRGMTLSPRTRIDENRCMAKVALVTDHGPWWRLAPGMGIELRKPGKAQIAAEYRQMLVPEEVLGPRPVAGLSLGGARSPGAGRRPGDGARALDGKRRLQLYGSGRYAA